MSQRSRPSALRYRLRGWVDAGEHTYLLEEGDHTVGGAETAELVIPVTGVSRRHALLRHRAGHLELEDLDSRNGTFVNGRRIVRREVRAGDAVRFGPVELVVEAIDADDAELGLILASGSPNLVASPIDQTTASLGGHEPTGSEPDAISKLDFPDDHLVGRSAPMTSFYRALQPLAAADIPVLIEGETGVGKESVARILHRSSARRSGPFVAVNCAAIPQELLEAEMFGIGEGVATGVRKRAGTFREADGGTLLLDEIGEMPLPLQAKLLRALQEGQVQPVGARAVAVDVRVIAASNVDLAARVDDGRFRRDLYYRVAGDVLLVPPLRERRDDIPPLIEHFLHRSAAGKAIRGLTVKALDRLRRYPWPGNVRELEHEVRRLAHLCPAGQAIDSTMLAERLRHLPAGDGDDDGSLRLADHVNAAERRAISQALERAGGSQRRAAKLLEISRNTLARKIRELDIKS